MKDGYTQVINGSLRLVIRNFENDMNENACMNVNTDNNMSLERFVRIPA